MANGIISATTRVLNDNEIDVSIDFEYDGSIGSSNFIAKIDTSQPTTSSPSLNVTGINNIGTHQFRFTANKTNLNYNTTYYVSVSLIDDINNAVVWAYTANATTNPDPTPPQPRITASVTLPDVNTANFDVDVVPQSGDPSMVPGVAYDIGAVGIGVSPEAVFDSQTSNPPHYYFTFIATTLKYDENYNYIAYLKDANNQTIVDWVSGTFHTGSNGSYITFVNVYPKNKSCKIDMGVYVDVTSDTYRCVVAYDTVPINYASRRQNANSKTSIDLRNKIAHFTINNLRKNTKYYFRLYLIDVTTDQVLDTYDGVFKTLKDGFPLWMYLHYFI